MERQEFKIWSLAKLHIFKEKIFNELVYGSNYLILIQLIRF